MVISVAMLIGMDITTVVSTAGMAGARSTTHGIIRHGMALVIGMTLGTMIHGITDMPAGMVDGMEVGMVGDHITHITTTGDGTDTIILFMEEVVAQDTTAPVVQVVPTMEANPMVAQHLHSDLVAASVLASQTGIERIV